MLAYLKGKRCETYDITQLLSPCTTEWMIVSLVHRQHKVADGDALTDQCSHCELEV